MEPTICNTPTIYNTGAGGGGGSDNYINVDGKNVKIKQIDSLIWTCENISVINVPYVVYNGDTSNDPRAYWYRKSVRNNGYGLLWNLEGAKKCLDYLIDLKNDGWRIPTKADFESLMAFYSGSSVKLKSVTSWEQDFNGTNESELNILPAGRYSGYDNWSSYNIEGYLISSTQQNASTNYVLSIFGNGDNYAIQSWYLNQCFSLRLCKDAL